MLVSSAALDCRRLPLAFASVWAGLGIAHAQTSIDLRANLRLSPILRQGSIQPLQASCGARPAPRQQLSLARESPKGTDVERIPGPRPDSRRKSCNGWSLILFLRTILVLRGLRRFVVLWPGPALESPASGQREAA